MTDTQDEIEKIMGEIEKLQEVMNETPEAPTAETVAEAEAETEPMAEFHSEESDVSMEETLADLHEEEEPTSGGMLASIGTGETAPVEEEAYQEEDTQQEEAPVPVRLAYERPEPQAMPAATSKPMDGGALSLRLTGSMTLTLQYDYEGEQVTVGFSDNMLKVQLSDGTEFKIPVRRDSKLRRVA
ncbi:MAG: hypothetical protein A2X94_13485 [Bdellovibrionales bacterium GWB1_55_8]|nr:MAG: hypothetical protein A2X94_13485 [Bdellovibrionales bacterium GWB1_55_8]